MEKFSAEDFDKFKKYKEPILDKEKQFLDYEKALLKLPALGKRGGTNRGQTG